ncbi:hypothetical protein OAI60_00955 [Flavobacteriaceae bacterium]|nr:hypothetical protein [Flavobacteriaceae bacterium]
MKIKNLLIIFILIPLMTLGQEKLKKGQAYIIPMGDGIYQSSITGKSGFSGTGKLKMKSLNKGKEFANEKDAELEVIGFETVEAGFAKFPQAIMTFRLVYESKQINNPNDPNKVTISKVGNKKNNNQQTVISSPSIAEDPKDKAIKELKKLKELLDLDLITKEEFDKKSVKLKKIILGN